MRKIDWYPFLLASLLMPFGLASLAQVNDYRLEAMPRNNWTAFYPNPSIAGVKILEVPAGTAVPYLFADTIATIAYAATGPGLPIGFDFVFDNDTFDRFMLSSQGYIKLGKSSSSFSIEQDTSLSGVYVSGNDIAKANTLSFFARPLSSLTGYNFWYATIQTSNVYPEERLCRIALAYQNPTNTAWFVLNVILYEGRNVITYHYELRYPHATQEVAVGLRGNQANTDPTNLHFRKVVSGQNTWLTSDTSDGSQFCDIDTACFNVIPPFGGIPYPNGINCGRQAFDF